MSAFFLQLMCIMHMSGAIFKCGISVIDYFPQFLQKRAIVEIGVNNPTETDIKLEVQIHGMGLSGDNQILVPAKGQCG